MAVPQRAHIELNMQMADVLIYIYRRQNLIAQFPCNWRESYSIPKKVKSHVADRNCQEKKNADVTSIRMEVSTKEYDPTPNKNPLWTRYHRSMC